MRWRWTDENLARLRSLWLQMHTADEIAAGMRISRKGVLGARAKYGIPPRRQGWNWKRREAANVGR